MTAPASPWRVERQRGAARLLLGAAAPPPGTDGDVRRVRILEVDRPAIVLGSNQPESDVDAAAAAAQGVEVARRRSGGAAVLVAPGQVVWVDVLLPAGDARWDTDVQRAMWWIGDVWAEALRGAGAGAAEVWRGAMQPSPWSGRVCFAGLGPGEVRIGSRKVVGVSQRRTRHGALFQTAALLTWDPAPLLAVLRSDPGERARGLAELGPVAAGVGAERAEALVEGLLAALPRY